MGSDEPELFCSFYEQLLSLIFPVIVFPVSRKKLPPSLFRIAKTSWSSFSSSLLFDGANSPNADRKGRLVGENRPWSFIPGTGWGGGLRMRWRMYIGRKEPSFTSFFVVQRFFNARPSLGLRKSSYSTRTHTKRPPSIP